MNNNTYLLRASLVLFLAVSLLSFNNVFAVSTGTPAIIVAIGDSITQGGSNQGAASPVSRLVGDLQSSGMFTSVTTYNDAVSGTYTGDWQPGGANLTNALNDIQNHGANIVNIMLGTNDAKNINNVSSSTFKTNMQNIIAALQGAGVQHIFISYQPYTDPVAQPAWSDALIQSYEPIIDSLDNGTSVRKEAYSPSIFAAVEAATTTYLFDGVHLTGAGVNLLGDDWAQSYENDMTAVQSVAPTLISVVSNKTHGSAGTFGISLPFAASTTAGTEDRSGGPTQLVMTFANPISEGPNFNVSLSSGAVASTVVSGNTLTINMSSSTNDRTLTVSVNNVLDASSQTAGNYSFPINVVLADIDANGKVNFNDFQYITASFNNPVNASNFKADLNLDGKVNFNDFQLLSAQFNTFLSN